MTRHKVHIQCSHDALDLNQPLMNALIEECGQKGIDPDNFGEIELSLSVSVRQTRKPTAEESDRSKWPTL